MLNQIAKEAPTPGVGPLAGSGTALAGATGAAHTHSSNWSPLTKAALPARGGPPRPSNFSAVYRMIVSGVPGRIRLAIQVMSWFSRRTQPWDTAVPGLAYRPPPMPCRAT
jgi:hypothetical protein